MVREPGGSHSGDVKGLSARLLFSTESEGFVSVDAECGRRGECEVMGDSDSSD